MIPSAVRRLRCSTACICLLFVVAMTGCSLVFEVNRALQQASGELQAKRALILNEQALLEFHEPDLVINVPSALIDKTRPAIVDALNKDADLAKEGVRVLDFSLDL